MANITYANLTNLALVIRSSQTSIGTAIDVGMADNQITKASYLTLSLCYQEYYRATNFTDRSLDPDGYETIAHYYNRIASEQSERHLLMFSGSEIEPILEQVGAAIRDTWSN
jgi:hypothetical protein